MSDPNRQSGKPPERGCDDLGLLTLIGLVLWLVIVSLLFCMAVRLLGLAHRLLQ
ncbi:hypothetical protein GGD56_000729 [Rhizobium mongolense]|uniref:Uncharacterized protein n=2 Tax=Rhizobium mongolense TaxID=57676 RepID=A0ABR6IH29_9HYPH|nr:hypothetical protein [Rhizobium mongolense]TVZ74122.1 hypothetical protein BCL32_2440 [Rhizobium mongolense USDA 1844]